MIPLPSPHTGPWKLEDLRAGRLGSPRHGRTVFSCFHCGGGSSMGYKLAGFNVLGGVEIDPKMMDLYRSNHRPDERLSFLMGVQDFVKLPSDTLPRELFELDVLDGSPPCSTFSMNGNREKDWGKERVFKEGQAKQVLSDLFFDFIDVAAKLRPKVVVSENVKGMVLGNARWYVKEVFRRFREVGYETQLFLLNGALMGVPQLRERVFFVSRRMDLALPKVSLDFFEQPITLGGAMAGLEDDMKDGAPLSKMALDLWTKTIPGESFGKAHPKGSWFVHQRSSAHKPIHTIIGGTPCYHWEEPRNLSSREIGRAQSFPDDYDYRGLGGQYVCGMSVPPLMMQRVALRVAEILP